MNMYTRLLTATAFAFGAVGSANAATTVVDVTGSLTDVGAFSGQLELDVVNGIAMSGAGTINLLTYIMSPISLITTSTPGNEDRSADYPGAPVGFRANDGTDYFALDQAFPFSTFGLLFAVGTSMPTPGGNPLLALYSNGDGTFGAQFTGVVDNITYFNKLGSFTFLDVTLPGDVPEPATWALMLTGFGAVGYGLRRRKAAVAFA